MVRQCIQCRHAITQQELAGLKAVDAGSAVGAVPGVRLLSYDCPECRARHVFVQVVRLAGETTELLQERRARLAANVCLLDSDAEDSPKKLRRRAPPQVSPSV